MKNKQNYIVTLTDEGCQGVYQINTFLSPNELQDKVNKIKKKLYKIKENWNYDDIIKELKKEHLISCPPNQPIEIYINA